MWLTKSVQVSLSLLKSPQLRYSFDYAPIFRCTILGILSGQLRLSFDISSTTLPLQGQQQPNNNRVYPEPVSSLPRAGLDYLSNNYRPVVVKLAYTKKP